MAVGMIMVSFLAAATPPAIVFQRDVDVRAQDVITLGDLADLTALPDDIEARARDVQIARFPAGAAQVTFPVARVIERARAGLPGLNAYLPASDAPGTIVVRAPAASTAQHTAAIATPQCGRVMRDLETDDAPTDADLAPSPCPASDVDTPFAYDAARHVVRATKALARDTVIGAPPFELLAAVQEGQTLRVAVTVGPVSVEREVTALAPAPGHARALFVRTGDGVVFSAPFPGDPP